MRSPPVFLLFSKRVSPMTSSAADQSTHPAPPGSLRVRVFVDYWNFQLSLNSREAKLRGLPDYRFRLIGRRSESM